MGSFDNLILYWNIGNIILDYQNKDEWGAKVIDNIAKEIKSEFQDLKGFSPRNLKYMRKFALEYKSLEFVQQVVAQITWSHNVVLMDRIEKPDYAERAVFEAVVNPLLENGKLKRTLPDKPNSKNQKYIK
ncbi:DUF1016 N-terminal domain-containing protein [Clostridium gelidum]|nr:DUF1016 N-terminal domain-containing protein [Clostridium gelidum]